MPECPHTFKAHPTINHVLNAEQAQYWWRNAIDKSTLDNIGHCPHQDCTGVFIIPPMMTCSLYAIFSRIFFSWFEDENKCYARCIKCSRGICVKCGLAWHLKSERCFKNSRAEKKRDSNQDTQSMDIRLADAQFKELSRKEGWTQCPYCGYVVSKSLLPLWIQIQEA
ncbi:hypothetical protein K492DRAFT_179809 [Lichtheimia hyalospora FSU 10163]|nr:hypothetical protein K492DRAFT_179809 [Lichtheimia hyalospora FSU 10163]